MHCEATNKEFDGNSDSSIDGNQQRFIDYLISQWPALSHTRHCDSLNHQNTDNLISLRKLNTFSEVPHPQ